MRDPGTSGMRGRGGINDFRGDRFMDNTKEEILEN